MSKTKNNTLSFTPREIVSELDRYIVGQNEAKKAVAIALRNRYRRKNIDSFLQSEIMPKNILMVGPTGVGKTEIARRLAKLANAPFLKVEATKFTEIGYVGRDVDSIIRDLADVAVKMVKKATKKEVEKKAEEYAKRRIVEVLIGEGASEETRNKFRSKLENGGLDNNEIEIDVIDNGTPSTSASFDLPGMQIGMISIGDIMGKAMKGFEKTKKKKMLVKDAIEVLTNEEAEKLVDEEKIIKEAIEITENDGIVFIDEIDKICIKNAGNRGDVSREGVQRDLLPLVEGSTISTKYGLIKTNHILFIASGAFHAVKPADLLPELQGRFPIRVQLKALTEEDLISILKEPEASLVKQYIALLETENITLKFNENGIKEIAKLSTKINSEVENIGARRLHTLVEKILEEISFEAPERKGETIIIDKKYVSDHLGELVEKIDLSKFIL